ncbi:hypothetical protein O6H91_02G040800 [Diphasiastrum complanatum]|uniref:Uncharacterized protein n=1 Tax=Diphasiastrum complanatum TaxID=34168 RepID=A0ACC2EEN6_DIPCM|nr:hypothetical protein O6H91_02G040800 [Diphasiastrum complanatum]
MASGWMISASAMVLMMLSSSFLIMIHSSDGANLKSEVNQPKYACADGGFDSRFQDFPFCNTSLVIRERVDDLVRRLTVSEKIELLVNEAAGVPRLGVPAYQWWQEALHGVADSPGVQFKAPIPAATSFPQVILTAASFNASLWEEIGKAVSTEGRAMYNSGLSGLTFWSPNINIFRDPRWGRGQETPGEDPLLTSRYAVSYVKGLQIGDYEGTNVTELSVTQAATNRTGPKRLKVSACCKHFTAYDMENSGGTDRRHFNAQVTLQDLEDTYNPPFKACVKDGGVSCIMCSYNRLNGVPTCADHNLLTKTIRQKWGLDGYIVSDCDAVAIIHDYFNYAPTPEDAVSEVLKAGLDLNCGTYISKHAQKAIDEGKLSEVNIDEALSKLVSVQMRLGLFDGNPKTQLFGRLGPEAVCTKENQHLALEAAREGIVLLKNEGEILPLSKESTHTLAVIGPHGNASDDMLGNYAALDMVEKVDAIVLIVGLNEEQEKEAHDRKDLLLPGQQQTLVTTVAAKAAVENHPVILVIMCGGPVDISFAKDNVNISSILWIGYPGEAGGKALAQIMYGDYNPAGGRLPLTWYPEEFVKVSMLNMHMRPNETSGYPGRTYRFYMGKTVYDFGHGRSFTNFLSSFVLAPGTIYSKKLIRQVTSFQTSPNSLGLIRHFTSELDAEDPSCENLNFDVTLNVTNTGNREGSHVLLLYAKPPTSVKGLPNKYLVAFDRIHLQAKKSKSVVFNIVPCRDLKLVQGEGKGVLYPGLYTLTVDEAEHSVILILDS